MSKEKGKKLVEILAVELKEWPHKRAAYCVQDGDGTYDVKFGEWGVPEIAHSGIWRLDNGADWGCDTCSLRFPIKPLADDYATAIVTREMWEAERAKLEGEKVMRACVEKCEPESKPKANAHGWVRNRGRKNPFDVCTLVDARLRSGDVVTGKFSDNLHWVHTGNNFDVMAYRVNESVEVKAAESEMPAAKYFDGPLKWRDRITEIDVAILEMGRERKSLIDRLAAEGFALIGRQSNSAV